MPHISTNNINELNELNRARRKLVSPQKARKKSKPGWEI